MYISVSLIEYYRNAVVIAMYCEKPIFHYLMTFEKSEKCVKNSRSYHLKTGIPRK